MGTHTPLPPPPSTPSTWGKAEMAAIMRSATATRVTLSAPKASKGAFMGNAHAIRASCKAMNSRAVRLTTTMASNSEVSSSYAAALMGMAKETGALEAIHADMDALETICTEDLTSFLSNSTVPKDKKSAMLTQIAKEGQFSPATGNFLALLVDKQRIDLLAEIIEEFDGLYCEETDTQVATVTSAVQLENEQQFLIAKKLQEMTGAKNIKLKPQVDASLIGGFVVTYGANGSQQIDMSVSGQLEKVASSMGVPMSATA